MKKNSLPLFLSVAVAALLPLLARAETVTLATGEKVEGKITSETETEVTLEIKVSSSIKDERVIARKDIAKIEKVSPEDTAFQEIGKFKIDPQSSLSPEGYDRIIGALKDFQASYPASAHLAEVKQTLANFQAEKTRVAAGEVKFFGKWLSRDEAAKLKIQIDGRQTFDAMKYQTARQDWSGALNTFDVIERKYSTARIYPDAVDLAVQILTNLQRQVAEQQKMVAYNQDQFKQTLAMAKPEDLQKIREGDKREQDQYAAAIAAAKKSGAKWGPIIPRSPESLNAVQAAIPGELTRLKALPAQKMHASVGLVDDAQAALGSGRTDSVESLIAEALKAWPQNEEAIRCKTEIGSLKKAKIAAAEVTHAQAVSQEKAAREKAAVTAAPTPAPVVQKPFYMTVKGALSIVGGVIVLIGAITLLSRPKKPKDRTE